MHYSIPFKPHPLLVLLTMTATGSLWANPQLPQVVHGQVTMAQAGKVLTVTNSPGAIINWQQFNIDRGELTRFVQQNAASQVLNRVVGVIRRASWVRSNPMAGCFWSIRMALCLVQGRRWMWRAWWHLPCDCRMKIF